MAGEISRKKKLSIALLVVALALPLFMASNWGLGMLESLALSNAPSDWAASLDLGVADFYGISLRVDKQKEVCENFLRTFKEHPRRAYAAYTVATCVEREVGLPNSYGRKAYEDFIDEYDDDPNAKEYIEEARRAIVRLRSN
jgi:hypothetical protein